MTQYGELLAHQAPALVRARGHELGSSVGKIKNLQRARILDEAGDVLSNQLFGADQHVDRRVFTGEQNLVVGVFRRPHPGDAGGRVVDGVRNLACDHVHFIAVGHGNEQFRLLNAGSLQHFRM